MEANRRVIVNVLVGIGIAGAIAVFHDSKWIAELEDAAMDAMMAVSQSLPRMSRSDSAALYSSFAFLDIDENTHREWGEPAQVPRANLLDLIRFAHDGGAVAVIVDVDLSRPGPLEADDVALADYLADASNRPDGPPVILIRSFYPATRTTDGRDYLLRATLLDNQAVGPRILWAQSLFKSGVDDRVIRSWQLVRLGCIEESPVLVPSIQLVTVSILSGGDRGLANTIALGDELNRDLPGSCRDIPRAERSLEKEIQLGRHRIDIASGRTGERLIYTIPYRSGPELQVVSAGAVVRATEPRAHDLVRDRVVVIGSSHADARDTYRTPIGDMPGAVILINAVKSLGAFGQVRAPNPLLKWTINFVLILFMAFIFSWLESLLAEVLTGLVIVIVLLPLSFYFFKYGIWIDFAVPLLGMQLHHVAVELGDSYSGGFTRRGA